MIRFFNGRTLTMADGVSVTTDEVWTDGDKIAYVGPTPETPMSIRKLFSSAWEEKPYSSKMSSRTWRWVYSLARSPFFSCDRV